jgi:RNA polymerase sigma-70 factor (ECF subfamily)
VESIYGFIYSRVGNREAAEDLTTRVFHHATRWMGDDRSDDSIRAWLYSIARGVVVAYWRGQAQQHSISTSDRAGLLHCDADPVKDVLRSRMRAQRILEILPERERSVLFLRLLQGYTVEKTAEALGIEPGNVRVIQLQALRRATELRAQNQAVPAGHVTEIDQRTM